MIYISTGRRGCGLCEQFGVDPASSRPGELPRWLKRRLENQIQKSDFKRHRQLSHLEKLSTKTLEIVFQPSVTAGQAELCCSDSSRWFGWWWMVLIFSFPFFKSPLGWGPQVQRSPDRAGGFYPVLPCHVHQRHDGVQAG